MLAVCAHEWLWNGGGVCITFHAAISQIKNVNIVTWQLRAGIVKQEDTAVTGQQQRNCCKLCFLFSPCHGYIADPTEALSVDRVSEWIPTRITPSRSGVISSSQSDDSTCGPASILCWGTSLDKQRETQPMRNEGAVCLQDQKQKRWGQLDIEVPFAKHHRHVPSKKKWWYACRLLGRSSLKKGTMWYVGWKLE